MDVVEVVLVEREHALVWADRLASGLADAAVTVGRHCPTCGSTDHGRPVVPGRPDVHVSLARAGGRAVVAVAGVPLGVDVEVAGAVDASALAAADLPAVGDPTLAWVSAEARGKLAGTGLRSPATDGVVHPLDLGHGLVAVVATRDTAGLVVREAWGAPGDAPTAPGTPPRRRR